MRGSGRAQVLPFRVTGAARIDAFGDQFVEQAMVERGIDMDELKLGERAFRQAHVAVGMLRRQRSGRMSHAPDCSSLMQPWDLATMTASCPVFSIVGVCMESPLRWQDSYEQLRSATNERQLFDRIAQFAKRLGFDYCCYGIRVPLPVSNPSVAIFDTYPEGWMKHYQESHFIDVDPTVREGMTSSRLIIWPEATSNAPGLWTDARDFGLRVGVAHSSWAAHGVYGLLTMARHADSLTPSEIDELTLQGSWLANLSHSLMSEFLVPRLAPEASVELTPRECEVLCWTGEGKTACEIGKILSISERTVNFHVNNVLLKLNATNKVQAVVKAIAMGLIGSV